MVLQNAYKTLMDIGGLETEAEYGYDGEDEACKFNRSKVSFFHLLNIFARSTNPMQCFLSSFSQVLQVDSGIFRSARTSCTTFDWSRPSALKIWITYIQAYMPYESCKDSSNQPYGPMASLGCPLDPLGPPGTPWQPPNRPPQTNKQVSWPYLKITSTASQITFTFIPVTPVTPNRPFT